MFMEVSAIVLKCFAYFSNFSLVKEVCVYVYVTQISVSRILANRYYILIYQLKY